MVASWREGGTVLRRVRARASGLDPLTARLRLSRLLASIDLRPAGLSPAALLWVRRFPDPLPRAFDLRDGRSAPPAAWVQAAADALARLLRVAARPALGLVPAGAEAVLFADAAEFLACLAADWCAETLASRWWWQALLRHSDSPQAVLQAWLDAPEYVPTALGHLARRGQLTPFARALPAAGARLLLQAVVRVFALPEIGAALDALVEPAAPTHADHPRRPTPPHLRRSSAAGLPAERLPPRLDAAAEPPWADAVPEAREIGLSLPARCLVGLGLMLHRAPATVRARPFAAVLHRWAHHRTAPAPDGAFPEADVRPPAPKPTQQAAPSCAADQIISEAISSTEPANLPSPGDRHAAPPLPEPAAPISASATVPLAGPDLAAVPSADAAPTPGESLETRQGGIFYLINLALFLGLYADFTLPARAELPLSLWDFLALLGERLAGHGFRSDPVWALLARLAGRAPDEPPDRDFTPPDLWRLPAGWLAAFPESAAWSWWASRDRLRVDHPAGFAVIDVAREPGPALVQAQRELGPYAERDLCEDAPHSTDEELRPLDRWLGWLVPYIRARLCRALGLTDADGLAGMLLAHRARVSVTATHLDVAFSLAELPLAVRLAGLDRDPGWVPAAGRFVAFHFE